MSAMLLWHSCTNYIQLYRYEQVLITIFTINIKPNGDQRARQYVHGHVYNINFNILT